jgi:predicted RecA/RadA family phage recombinase
MAQTPALMYSEGGVIDYTPGSAVIAGQVVLIGTIPMIAPSAIAASAKGALTNEGLWKVPKATGAITAGDAIYWDEDGSPVTGTALSGACTGTATGNNLMGYATADAASGDTYTYVELTAAKRTTTLGGSVTADDITGSDSSLAVAGAPPATTSSAGGAVAIAGGIGGSVSGTGGAVSATGGAGTAAAATGGLAKIVGGVGGTSGTAGAAQVIGGASAGASGTAGAATIDAGAATGGTGSTVRIAETDALGTYINRGPLKSPHIAKTLTALGTVQSSTPTSAQLLGGMLSQTGSTGAGTVTLPTGTALSAACPRTPVTGDTFECDFYNLGGSQTLTITGATGTTVVGTAAVGTGKNAKMTFYSSGSNTWNIYVTVSA